MTAKSNFVINQGTTFQTFLELTDDNGAPLDITSYVIESSLRKYYTSNTAYNFACDIQQASNGIFTITMNANTTASIGAGRYVYDIKTTDPSGNVARVLEGIITVSPEVTG